MSIERSILIRIWMTHCVCFSSYTSPTSFFRCFQHPTPTWTVHDHKTMTEHFIFFFYLQLPSLPHTLRPILFPLGYPFVRSFFFNVRFRRSFHCYPIATFMALQLPNLWLPITELPKTGFYLSRFSSCPSPHRSGLSDPLKPSQTPFGTANTLLTFAFHAFTLPHFSALIFYCLGPSLLWLLISDSSFLISHSWFLMPDYSSPVLSRRYNFSTRMTSLLATFRCCVRPPTLIQSETSFFLLHCCILSTPWSITVWLADGSCRFTCVVGLFGACPVSCCFSSLSSSFHSLSRVSVPFNRCIQSPKTLSCVGSTRLLTVPRTIQLQILPLSLFTSTQTLPHKWRKFLSKSSSQSLHTLGLC